MAEKIFDAQVNYGWGLSLNMTGKAPAVAKRIFDKYEDAFAYANDVNDSAIEGLVLSVVADDATKNGLYFVKQVATQAVEADEEKGIEGVDAKEAILVKISTNADSQATADEVQELLNAEISARTEADQVLSGAIDANVTAIEVLSGAIDTNKDALDVVSGLAETNKTAIEVLSGAIDTNKDALDVVSGLAETNKTDIATVSGKVDNLLEVAIPELQGNIKDNADAISAITTTYKIKEVVGDDLMLSVDNDGKLSSTLGIQYDSTGKKITLVGINGAQIGDAIDATDFIKDGMLQNVELKTVGSETKLVFTFNTDSGKEEIPVDVTSLLNGTELHNLEASLSAHTASTTVHFTGEEKGAFIDLIGTYNKTALDAKFSENVQAHTDLSAEIASAKTDINTVSGIAETNKTNIEAISGDVQTLSGEVKTNKTNIEAISGTVDTLSEKVIENEKVTASAMTELQKSINLNADNISAISGEVSTVKENISAISGEVSTVKENIEAISGDVQTLSGEVKTNKTNIEAISGDVQTLSGTVKTLSEKVTENEEVVAAAITDLKATKVSAITAQEGSNIVINEVKDENGISYTIGFQWLTF